MPDDVTESEGNEAEENLPVPEGEEEGYKGISQPRRQPDDPLVKVMAIGLKGEGANPIGLPILPSCGTRQASGSKGTWDLAAIVDKARRGKGLRNGKIEGQGQVNR